MLFFPFWRDEIGNAIFFQPVFNIADSAITLGVISILLFQRHYFSGHDEKKVATHKINLPEDIFEKYDNQDIVNNNSIDTMSENSHTIDSTENTAEEIIEKYESKEANKLSDNVVDSEAKIDKKNEEA